MISVILPAYNAEKFLKHSIDSILNQTEKDFELIIVNDGSTDNSEDIILSYNDPRIAYVKQENQGAAAARNTGLDIAKGEFIAWQDADDVSLPYRLKLLKDILIINEADVAHSDMLLVNESNKPVGYWQSQNIVQAHLVRFFLKTGTPFNNGSMLIRKKLFKNFKHDTSLRVGSDSDMVFQVTPNSRSIHVAKPLYIYRLHSSNISRSHNQSDRVAHIQKFLVRHSLEELVPELDWKTSDTLENQARAYAIVSLFLSRRGLTEVSNEWLEKAKAVDCSTNGKLFIRAISLMLNGSYELAGQVLSSCVNRDYITDNYLGEVTAFSGDLNSAYKLFLEALEKNPYYIEPVDNLRGLGGFSNLQLVDNTWLKYKKVS